MTSSAAVRPRRRARRSEGPHPRAVFVREALRNPASMSAVVPSSRRLAERMVEDIDLGACRSIVEFGPGSGVMTRAILKRLPKGWSTTEGGKGTLIAIEFNPRMAEVVARDFPRAVVVADSAANIEKICAGRGIGAGELDLVISSLGWAGFPPEMATSILEATARMLRPGGDFRTFAYHLGLLRRNAWHLRSELRRLFSEVRTSRPVWANLPPAFVYRCVK